MVFSFEGHVQKSVFSNVSNVAKNEHECGL